MMECSDYCTSTPFNGILINYSLSNTILLGDAHVAVDLQYWYIINRID